jgi:hypothetical protein
MECEMKSWPIPDRFEKKVVIPVHIKNGKIEFFYGGKLPEFNNDVIGDLVVPAYCVKDQEILKILTLEKDIEILPKDSNLLVRLYIDDKDSFEPEKKGHFKKFRDHFLKTECGFKSLMGDVFVEILLKGALVLNLKGTKIASLQNCEVSIPVLEKEAISLNHAYSILSWAYEKSRRAHTGNVFKKIYFKGKDRWLPLENLRNAFESMEEARLIIDNAEWEKR